MSEKGEFELVGRLTDLLRPDAADAIVPIGDDMAVLEAPEDRILAATDMLMEGVDFRRGEHEWHAIGRKAMAVNLSDCAAMAARPKAALVAVSLSDDLSMDDAVELVRGARECGLAHGCPIVGGDTNSWQSPTVIAVTIFAVPYAEHPPVRRDGACPGDRICLSGPVGGSILGRHMTFEPRIKLAQRIGRELRPHAMIDISDGLAIDLWRILEASKCGARLDAAALERVIHSDARTCSSRDGRTPLDHALYDGEDFELIVAVPPTISDESCRDIGLTPVGRMIPEQECSIELSGGQIVPVEKRGWEHFR